MQELETDLRGDNAQDLNKKKICRREQRKKVENGINKIVKEIGRVRKMKTRD